MQDVRRTVLYQLGTMTQIGAQQGQKGVWAKGCLQEAQHMQALDPLTVFPIRFASRWDLDLLGIDQEHSYATRFEDLINRQPVDTGRLHGHRVNATRNE